jgi:hypothetical protein
MTTTACNEWYALDRKNWKEVPEKYVLKSGYIYLGTRFMGKEVRVFIEN